MLANRSQGLRAVGGTLDLVDGQLQFRPNVFDGAFGGESVDIDLSQITGLGIEPGRLSLMELFSGGLLARLRVELADGSTQLFVVKSPEQVGQLLETARTTRSEPGSAQPPRLSMAVPDERGRVDLGELEVGDLLTLLHGGFPGEPGDGDGPVEDLTERIGTRPGRWHVYLWLETEPSALAASALEEAIDYGAIWLVAAHESVTELPDTFDAKIPEVGEWIGKLSLVPGEPTPEQIQAIRHSPNSYVDAWDWGVTWLRPRCGLPVALGGPPGAREWVALLDTVRE